MIRNQWYVILESREVKRNRPVGVVRLSEKLVIWRDSQGKVNAISDLCPHLGASLSHGKVHEDWIACPFHGMAYDKYGKCQYVPALGQNSPVPKSLRNRPYQSYEAQGFIWIWWGEGEPSPAEPAWFDIDASFSYSGFSQHWPMHYSRMVENQLDVMHLPFVHASTIGRGNRRLVDGPVVKLQANTLSLWVSNRKDDGSPPRKAEDLPERDTPAMLTFQFPNLWQNRLGDDMRVVAAFVPIDDNNTKIYLRLYQRMVKFPIARQIFHFFADIGNRVILNQDRRVVLTQVPKKTKLKKMGEILLPGDRGVLMYRTHRQALKENAGQVESEL